MSINVPYSPGVPVPYQSPIHMLVTDQSPEMENILKQVRKEYPWYQIDVREQTLKDIQAHMKRKPNTEILLLSLSASTASTESCKQLKAMYPKLKVFYATNGENAAYVRRAIGVGAMGYIRRNILPSEFNHAVKRIIEGNTHYDEAVKDVLIKSLEDEILLRNKPGIELLTRREVEVLTMVGLGMTALEIAAALHISKHTVETHRRNLLHKLGVKNSLGLVRFALKRGYVD